MVVKLFAELGPRYKARNGGYLRILKFGFRQGDNAPMALVELVDRPEPVEEARDTGDSKVRSLSASTLAAKKGRPRRPFSLRR